MIFTFKSATSADLIMLESSGKEILSLLGKDPTAPQGIITVEQLPAAISTLQAAVLAEKGQQAELDAKQDASRHGDEPVVRLSQRALPFIEMLERALKDGKPLVWGA